MIDLYHEICGALLLRSEKIPTGGCKSTDIGKIEYPDGRGFTQGDVVRCPDCGECVQLGQLLLEPLDAKQRQELREWLDDYESTDSL